MDIRQCYEALGGSYDEVLKRLMNNENILKKFLFKFLDDQSYSLLVSSLESGDGQTAFRAAHTLKGVCQNLSLTRLADSASELTEALRGGTITAEASALAEKVDADYRLTEQAISAFRAQSGG